MEDDNYSQKLLCAYQSVWSISVLVSATLALTLPFAKIVIWRIDAGNLIQEVDLDVDILKCFTSTYEQEQDEALANEVHNLRHGRWENSTTHPSFVWRTRLGSLGIILFFLFTGVILTMQAQSIVLYGCSTKFIPQHFKYSGCSRSNDVTSLRLMVAGSLSLHLGLLWYAIVMMSALNGGSFIYGYWITQMAALFTLVVAWGAYRDKNILDSIYQAIPDLPEQYNGLSQLDDLLDYEPKLSCLDVYQTASSLSSIVVDKGQLAA